MSDTGPEHQAADAALARRDVQGAEHILSALVEKSPSDLDGWMKLAAVLKSQGRPADALSAVDRALSLQPLFYLALLLKASLLESLGRIDNAVEFYNAANFHAEGKDVPTPVARRLQHGRHVVSDRAAELTRDILSNAALAGINTHTVSRFIDNVVRRRPAYHQEPTHYRWPGLPDTEFFDDYRPPWLAELEAATDVIERELRQLMASRSDAIRPYVDLSDDLPAGQWAGLNRSAKWNAIHLVRYGKIERDIAARCPETMRAASTIPQPDIDGLAPNLMFSLLAPGTHIPPHHGVANFRSVLHLPLIVPSGCRFRVGADERTWSRGRAWIFDDTIEHEAWNDSDEPRVILIADVWRPELDHDARSAIRATMSAMTRDAHRGAL